MFNPCLRIITSFFIGLGLIFTPFSSPSPVFGREGETVEYAARMEAFLVKQMETYKIPGLAIAIVRNGEVEYQNGYGIANPSGDPVTPDTPFLLASVSKSFTAVAVMQLVEEGQLELDAPVHRYLPWFSVDGEGGPQITVAHLLYQSSGFSEYDGNEINMLPDGPNGREESVRALSSTELAFQPGEGWEYSNINYNVLGVLVQEVSGRPYEDYIKAHVFAPLEMDHSFTSRTTAWDAGAARGYNPFFGIPLAVEPRVSETVGSSAGLWSSAADMSRYLIAQLGDGSDLGLTDQAQTLLQTSGAAIEPGFGYAMGWFHASNFLDPEFLKTLNTNLEPNDDLRVLWHEGDWKGYKSMVLLLPGLEYGVVLLMNINDPTIASVYKNFAWDVTLIANGGEAYYFQPSEDFLVRYSRWIFGGLTFVLLSGQVWSWKRLHRAAARSTYLHTFPLLINAGLLAYIYLRLFPENNTNLRGLVDRSPDLGLLAILVTVFAVSWIVVSGLNLVKPHA